MSSDLLCIVSPLSLSGGFYLRATWNAELCFGLDLSGERSGQLFIMLSWLFRQINKGRDHRPWWGRNEKKEIAIVRPLILSSCPPTLFISSCCCPSAPEVVARHRYGRPVDCWAVGVIMFILWVFFSDYQSNSTSNTIQTQPAGVQSGLIYNRHLLHITCSSAVYQVTHRFTMRQRRRIQTCIIASSSVASLLVTLSLILRIGMTFHLQVHSSTTRWQ